MKLITLDQARAHCKGDGDDDGEIITLANAAEAACAKLANRNLYATTTALNAAVAGVTATMQTAYNTYDAAVTAAEALTDERMKAFALNNAEVALRNTTNKVDAILHGLALDAAADANGTPVGDDIISAILMTVAHFYRNRESVISGQGAAAVELPMSAQHIMQQNRWIGPL